jgi:hypothetical protein
MMDLSFMIISCVATINILGLCKVALVLDMDSSNFMLSLILQDLIFPLKSSALCPFFG